MNNVILVDKNDQPIGTMPKMEAHETGVLHRAFSIFLFNTKNELLLQKRAPEKYHSPNLWTNTCCSHPAPGEFLITSAQKRLIEEMGITTSLTPLFSFIYKIAFNNGLIEHEYDHVLIGEYSSPPLPNPDEACDWRYASLEEIDLELEQSPDSYTYWFKLSYKRVFNYIHSKKTIKD